MSNAPAGWYPQDDGRQRYWDGNRWSEHFAPGVAKASESEGAPGSPPAGTSVALDRPWYKKMRFLVPSGVVALCIFLGMAVAASGGSSSEPTQAAGVRSTNNSQTPSSTPSPATPSPTATKAKATTTPKPTPTPKPAAAETLTARKWQKIVKDPDAYSGDRYIVYGEINQFDAATGTDTFLADVAHKNTTSYGFFEGENTLLTGDEGKLEDFVEGDVFRATVSVVGSFSYDTQIGGNTTVPLLQIEKIKRVGNNS